MGFLSKLFGKKHEADDRFKMIMENNRRTESSANNQGACSALRKVFYGMDFPVIMLKLDKLYQTIAEKEKELDNIRRIGTLSAGVSADYVHTLRAEHLSYQREYNLILEQNSSLANSRNKIIIDTFKDHWLEKVEYQIGESVEIDIDKRLQNPEKFPLYFLGKIGEDCQYDFYTLEGAFLKRDKKTSQVIYLGEGRVSCYLKRDETSNSVSIDQELVTATVFNNWIYWYESQSITSDKFIYRRSTDGRLYEQLDWLSNEKTITSNGHSTHSVSEDKVRKMSATPLELIIEVNRITRDENYIITVKETKEPIPMEFTEGEGSF